MDLSGPWRAAPAHEELRRTFHEPDLDDRAWVDVDVPGHWARAHGLAGERAVLHRRSFEFTPTGDDRRVWLKFDGIAQQGDIWLDGAYVGDTDGYFVPHLFEITGLLSDRRQHVLAVDVNCSRFGANDDRTSLMGALQDPELNGAAGANPGGIWQPVSLYETGTSAIRHFRAICVDASQARARMSMRCVFDHPGGGPVVLRTTVAGHDHELHHPAAVGENRVEWTIDIPEPALWWPHSLGDQPLHDLQCELMVDGEAHDERSCRTGFRSLRMERWVLSVNGQRLFTKGIVMLPTRPRPADASPIEVAGDVRAAKEAGLDLIRLISHVGRPEVYDTADEQGMLVWQDLPLRGLMARGVRAQAVRQAREAVDLLGHHPSVSVWCAHDEPFKRPITPSATPPLLGQQRPSWNRAVLDASLKRVLQRTDGSRPIVAHTAVPPHVPQLDGTTSHLWFGWHGGRPADLAPALARVPRMGRFVTAFGAASINPELPELSSPRWPALNWEAIGAAIGAPPASLHHLVSPTPVADGPNWAGLTQTAQAEVIRTAIETLRRLKYRPTGGFTAFYLADPSRAGGFGVLDDQRRPKPAWQALVDSCRPVIVVSASLPVSAVAGQRLSLDVHVVSDLRTPLADATVKATITQPDGTVAVMNWGGSIPADDCVLVGRVESVITAGAADLVLDLELETGDAIVTNQYRSPSAHPGRPTNGADA